MNNQLLKGTGFLLFSALAWGGFFTVAKPTSLVVDANYMALIRYLPSSIIFAILLLIAEGKSAFQFEGKLFTLMMMGTMGFAGFNLFVFHGLEHAKPEHGAVMMATMPMLTLLISWLWQGKKPSLLTLMMIVMAFLGVFLVITGGNIFNLIGNTEIASDLMLLMGAVCWVVYTMGAAQFKGWSALRYTTLTALLGTVSITLICAVLTMMNLSEIPNLTTLWNMHWNIAYIIIVTSILAVLSWNIGIRSLGPVNGVLFINFVPVAAFIIGIILGHQFSVIEFVGAALVLTALITNNLYIRRVNPV
jgi:drug/metabolite transporter (DMT)-like permease